MRTQEDEARGTDELDEGYLTRGGADEANWPAPQQAPTSPSPHPTL